MKKMIEATVSIVGAVLITAATIEFCRCSDPGHRYEIVDEWARENPDALQNFFDGDNGAVARTFWRTPVRTARLAIALLWV